MAIDITALLTSFSQTTVLKYLLNLLVGSCHKWLAGSSKSFNQKKKKIYIYIYIWWLQIINEKQPAVISLWLKNVEWLQYTHCTSMTLLVLQLIYIYIQKIVCIQILPYAATSPSCGSASTVLTYNFGWLTIDNGFISKEVRMQKL